MNSRRVAAKPKAREPIVRRHRPDYLVVLFMGLLMMVGLVVLYSISPARAELINANTNSALGAAHFMQRQAIFLAIGLAVFAFASYVPTKLWRDNAWRLLLLALAVNALLAFLGLFMKSGLVIEANGAVRWFNLGFTSFQPAELLKFAVIIYTAVFLGRRIKEGKLNSMTDTLVPIGIMLAITGLFVIVFQKDMGTGITMLGALVTILFVSGMDRKWLVTGIGTLVVAGIGLIITSPHRVDRVITFFQPSGAGDASTYHINQAMIALGSGGFFGKGLGQGVQAFGYLPEALNDSIFAILGETFGFVGLVVIMILFGALLQRILVTADKTADTTNRLIVAGIFGLLTSHIVVNIGAMTGLFPLTGVTLPFLSLGGTSLMFTMLSLGVVFYISRYTTHQKLTDKEDAYSETAVRRRGVGRTRNPGSRRYQRTG